MIFLRRLKSLQARLLTLLLAMVTLVWLGAAILTWLDASDELGELLDGHLAQSAALLVAQQTGHGKEESWMGNHIEDAQPLHKYAPRVVFQVFHEGELTLRSANAGDTPLSKKTRGFDTIVLKDGTEWRIFAAQGNEGDVQVFVGEQTSSRKSILLAVLQGVLTPLLYALPLLAVVGWLAVRRGLAPLRQLSRVLAQRQPQAIEPVDLGNVPSEIAPVVLSLNTLFERIGSMLVSERRFTADAAHELRTPIAAIRTQAQVALGAGDDAEQRNRSLKFTLEGCDRATHLVEQLLTLSRLEATSARPPASSVDLSAITRRVASALALTALERHQVLELDAPAACLIPADEMLASVLVRNLLDNALRYSPDGAKVCLSVSCASGEVMLQVDDSGPGLSDVDMARLGERFFRVLGTAQTGSGLGWSIVQRIAGVYAARVTASRSARLGGLCVKVQWPTTLAVPA